MLLPYTMASVFFGLTVSCLVRYRENVMTFPDFTRHFFSSLADSVDGFVVVVLNR